ncbi:MAG: oxygen-independent coproporphyrinogen III oxidase [Flavipsychrobacter sp.]|nr:oxygen-independent coproporphyrinogen III oxidase [Flavipsychrobacter sp.]
MNFRLLNKYNIPVPRYTSYPTVPYWSGQIDVNNWKDILKEQFHKGNKSKGISLYIHLPFCESLCTYCGCNKKITTNHSVEETYIAAVLKEWRLYMQLMDEQPVIREIHLGGGTPTFFSSDNLYKLIATILKDSIVPPEHDFSFEGHPNNTSAGQLIALYNLGFRRVSYGVQDHNPEVQRVINRIQPFEEVKRATEMARHIGFTSVNFDLIYGLPLQNKERMRKTLMQSISLQPDRVAFYSYAHVPWTSKGQRLFDEHDLPTTEEKMKLYLLGKQMFAEAGYTDIGMDHFALPHDDLHKAWAQDKLHRNFMGYTTQNTSLLLGLGMSSISDTGNAFAQNSKALHDYYSSIDNGAIPIEKGYFLTKEDIAFKKYILDISCNGKTTFSPEDLPILAEYTFPMLQNLENDGMLLFDNNMLAVTEQGRNFIRIICSAFDLHLLRSQSGMSNEIFSKAI